MRHVLLIDDEPDIRAVARMSIELVAGWQFSEASSALAGLDMARSVKPDVVLVDVMMPGIDGITAAHEFRADAECSSIPLIFMTASTIDESSRWLADGVIRKPFDPMTLGDDIARLLGWTT